MELRQLQHFLAVVETGNYHRAAERVNLTQQAVSKSIRQLEDRLGARLLERHRHGVVTTLFGDLLLPHARSVTAEIAQFGRGLDAALGEGPDAISLGATPTALAQLVPRALRALLARRPATTVTVNRGGFDDLAPQLLRGGLDLVVSTKPDDTADPLLAVEELGLDRNVIVVRAGHPILALDLPTVEDLARFPWISISNFSKAASQTDRLFGAAGLAAPAPRLVSSSIAFALKWVRSTDSLVMVPEALAADDIDAGRLVTVPTALENPSWPLILAYRRNSTRSPATLALIDELRLSAEDSVDGI